MTVAAVIEQDDHYLLVEELIDGQQVLNQPAGHLERGESLQAAIVREVWEETAREFTPDALVGIYRWQVPGGGSTYLRFCFTGTVGERKAGQALDTEIVDTCWLDYVSLQAHARLRSPMVLQCIEDYRSGRRVALELLHDLG